MNLLSGEAAEKRPVEELAADDEPVPWISLLKPNISITMIDDFTAYHSERVPEHVSAIDLFPHPHLDPQRRSSSTQSRGVTRLNKC